MTIAKPRSLIVVLSGIALYTAILTYVTWVRYELLQAPTFDMGVNMQIMSSILKTGLPLETPNWAISNGAVSTNFFGVHFSPIRYLLAVAYWIHPTATTLLFLQALFVGLGALPLYKLCKHLIKDERMSILFSIVYLVFPPLIMSNLYDFHEEAMIPFLLISAYYLFVTKQFTKSLVFFVLTLLVQESANALVFVAALQLLVLNWKDAQTFFRNREWNPGAALATGLLIASPAAFLLENLVFVTINPIAGFIPTAPTAYALSLSNFLLYLPQKTAYWIILLGLTAFLPLLHPRTLIMAAPSLVVSLFSQHTDLSQLYWQYSFLVVPALFIGAIYGLGRLKTSQRIFFSLKELSSTSLYRSIPILLLILPLIFNPFYPLLVANLPAHPHLVNYYSPPSNQAQLDQLFHIVPAGASVLASDFVFAHVPQSMNVYPIIYGYDTAKESWYLVTDLLPANFTPDYVAIVPSDYAATAGLIRSFPTSYIRLAEVTINYTSLVGFNSFETGQVTVSLYQHHPLVQP